jgi:hypothetical protein
MGIDKKLIGEIVIFAISGKIYVFASKYLKSALTDLFNQKNAAMDQSKFPGY